MISLNYKNVSLVCETMEFVMSVHIFFLKKCLDKKKCKYYKYRIVNCEQYCFNMTWKDTSYIYHNMFC